MVEKLRKKFIIISVTSVFIVVFIIASFSNLFNYMEVVKKADQLLNILSENDGLFPLKENRPPEYKLPPKLSPEAPFSTRFFTVKLDSKNNIIGTNTGKVASVTTDEALQYVNNILENNRTKGFIDNYKYRLVEKPYGYLFIFVDSGPDLQMFYSFLKSSIIMGLVGVLAVFILVLIFSKKAIEPIAESYEKQKRFITDVSHELKTPLTIIGTNTEVLEIDNGENQWTKSIRNQITRLSALVEGLVSLARMDEENNKLLNSNFSLSQLVLDNIEQFQKIGREYNKEFVIDVEKDVLYYGNKESLNQLISILMDNALKYSPINSKINIILKKQNKKIKIQIINKVDNLAVTNYEKLFERFYRLDSSRNSKMGGHGIGLSIAKAIVEKHKGSIKAESKDGKNIIFSIEL